MLELSCRSRISMSDTVNGIGKVVRFCARDERESLQYLSNRNCSNSLVLRPQVPELSQNIREYLYYVNVSSVFIFPSANSVHSVITRMYIIYVNTYIYILLNLTGVYIWGCVYYMRNRDTYMRIKVIISGEVFGVTLKTDLLMFYRSGYARQKSCFNWINQLL